MTSVIGPIDIEEQRPVLFDFSGELKTGETLTSVTAIEITVQSGADPTPTNILIGSPVINGSVVNQMVKGGILNASYHLRCLATTSLSSKVVVSANLRVVSL